MKVQAATIKLNHELLGKLLEVRQHNPKLANKRTDKYSRRLYVVK
jgi:hypothetical protein